jgi:hypothetical protein
VAIPANAFVIISFLGTLDAGFSARIFLRSQEELASRAFPHTPEALLKVCDDVVAVGAASKFLTCASRDLQQPSAVGGHARTWLHQESSGQHRSNSRTDWCARHSNRGPQGRRAEPGRTAARRVILLRRWLPDQVRLAVEMSLNFPLRCVDCRQALRESAPAPTLC